MLYNASQLPNVTTTMPMESTSKVKQRRSRRVCENCHIRKLRCNVEENGTPCSNCVVYQSSCTVRRRKNQRLLTTYFSSSSRADRRLPGENQYYQSMPAARTCRKDHLRQQYSQSLPSQLERHKMETKQQQQHLLLVHRFGGKTATVLQGQQPTTPFQLPSAMSPTILDI